tara:strand:+ start:1728 stop:2351 length:624 start_codon:yes stop_codon:yes gene_type:complete
MTRIGITVSQKFDSSNLIKLLEKFGATHELLSSNTNIENSGIEGLIITGSISINGKQNTNNLESDLLDYAYQNKIPVLAIGNGMIVMNLNAGGSFSDVSHDHFADHEDESNFHRIFISPGCRLASIVGAGGFVRVNSRHQIGVLESDKSHQLISSAWSLEDGVVEAVQHSTYHTAFGVQFLPDTRLEIPPHFDRLFENLIYDVNHTI